MFALTGTEADDGDHVRPLFTDFTAKQARNPVLVDWTRLVRAIFRAIVRPSFVQGGPRETASASEQDLDAFNIPHACC